MFATVVLVAALSCGGCTGDVSSSAIFERPQSYVGQHVAVCGYVHLSHEDTNIWPDKRTEQMRGGGLGVIYLGNYADAKRIDRTTSCLSGEIVRTDCSNIEKTACNYSLFDYAIRVSK